ncbi:MAG: PAS domain-containing protein [Lewinellaceae bacterium]|nr:PAS domain-containing protein [Phaeodactylibacter sp.]MCB9041408.1 PAS domain-containing protein [Lewinellaceae bacterium]
MLPNIAVILTDAQRKILWVNDDFTEITGYTLTEVIGKKPSLLQGPKTEKDAINRIRRSLENEVAFMEEITNYRKNGEPYICRLVIHPVFNRDQQLTNYIAFEVDGNVVKDTASISLLQLQEKYSSSSLKGVEEVKLYFKVKALMENEKLFLDPNLSLKEVADQLHTNTKYLSQVVNHHAGCNFQFFINTYRVKEVKSMITSDDYHNLTLFGIALQCGFKNKSTFYKVFKEISGQTPKEYIKMAEV